MTASDPVISISVRVAFRACGALNAGTTLAAASLPVSATAPAEKARTRSSMPTASRPGVPRPDCGNAAAGMFPLMTRTTPTPMSATIAAMYA